jgi:hypothetical protein
MAYVDFASEPMLAVHTRSPQHDAVEARAPRYSALEWSVIALARRDRLSSLKRPGRVAMAMAAVFGTGRQNPRLADTRLEALRRMAVLGWHHGFAVPVREEYRFLKAGFSIAQLETLLMSVVTGRSRAGARA